MNNTLSHYVVIDTHTGLTASTKFARRARAAAIADNKNKREPGRYVVEYRAGMSDSNDCEVET